MPRYDRVFATLANRAIEQGAIDVETFLAQMVDAGVSESTVMEMLLNDLDNNGPVFGKFLRSMTGAAGQSVLAAERQGNIAGTIDGNAEYRRLVEIADLEDAIEDADPEALAEVENAADRIDFTWIATLVNTCHRCLPIHGTTRTMAEWRAAGLLPETVHEGWDSPCYCMLIPADETAGRGELVAPLVRKKVKSPTGLTSSKRTARSLAQKDLGRAMMARDKAMQTPQGRRTLRLLGMALEETIHGGD